MPSPRHDRDHRGPEDRRVEAARRDARRAAQHLAVELLVRAVGDDGEIVDFGREAARAGPLAEHADHGELVAADADGLADRIDVREERLPRTVAEQHDAAPMLDLRRDEEAAGLDLGEVDRRPVLGGAEDGELLGALAAVVDARSRVADIAEPDIDQRHRRALPFDRPCVLHREIRPARHLEEAAPGGEAQGAPLLHDDRVRSELADRIAQRVVEAADERRHADDRGDADHHAEHGQRRAHLARAQRVERHADDLAEEARAHPSHSLLPPQRFDGVELRRPHRRIHAEEQADQRRDANPHDHRPELHRRRQRRDAC